MATAEEIAALRLLIAEPDNTAPYDDVTLGARLDADGNQYETASQIWTEKAASAAGLVDMTEGGSTRKMGDLYEQALSMAKEFGGLADSATSPPNGASLRIKRLKRP